MTYSALHAHRFSALLVLLAASLACGGSKGAPAAHDTAAGDRAPATVGSPVDTAGTLGATSGAIVLLKGDSLRAVADRLVREATTGRTLIGSSGYRVVVSRRAASGSAEVHEQWMDVTLVQAGRATVIAGGRLEGGRLEAGGEWRSGTIVGGTPYPLHPGDLFVVPAGIPHQFQLAQGDTIRYLTIKVPRAR